MSEYPRHTRAGGLAIVGRSDQRDMTEPRGEPVALALAVPPRHALGIARGRGRAEPAGGEHVSTDLDAEFRHLTDVAGERVPRRHGHPAVDVDRGQGQGKARPTHTSIVAKRPASPMRTARSGCERHYCADMEDVWPHLAPAVDVRSFLEPISWGKAGTHHPPPAALEESARVCGTRRIAGVLDEVEVNLAITRAPVVEDAFVWAGASLQRRLRLEPGDPVSGRLAPVDPSVVPLPDDVAVALDDPVLRAAWNALTPATAVSDSRRSSPPAGPKPVRGASTRPPRPRRLNSLSRSAARHTRRARVRTAARSARGP